MAKTKNIHVLAFPPHTTSWLQPIDGKVVGPFSKAFNKACSEFLSDSPGIIITKDQRNTVINFHSAWDAAVTTRTLKLHNARK